MTMYPESVAEVQELVRQHETIAVRGAGTKSGADRTSLASATLAVSRMNGITEYSADECVFTALAGTPLGDINAVLTANGQYLPFDPPLVSAGATIGGTVAAGVSGSGRYRYGGVRDFLIGVRLVDGDGRVIRSGGKVVKNAAGFLLHHGLVGSLGRFGILTEVTFKVFPVPEARVTVRVERGSIDAAADTTRAIEAERRDLEAIDFDGRGTMWMRMAGRRAALPARAAILQSLVGGTLIDGAAEETVWKNAQEFSWARSGDSIVRVPLTTPIRPALSGDACVEGLEIGGADVRYSSGGRCLWVATSTPSTLSAQLVAAGLRGVVVRGPQAGARVGVIDENAFEARVRGVLDPHNKFRAAPDSGR